MKITSLPFDPKCVSMSVERAAKRSPNVHLSSIIKDRLITAGINRKVTGGKPFTPEQQHLLFERGFLWERMVAEFCDSAEWFNNTLDEASSRHFAAGMLETSNLTRPGECSLDGIYMTPDAIDIKNYWVEEWKSTAIRFKGFSIEERRPEWLWQACSYANIFGMTKAVFRIWHINDNAINALLIEWEQEEVKENWRRLMEHYSSMKARK